MKRDNKKMSGEMRFNDDDDNFTPRSSIKYYDDQVSSSDTESLFYQEPTRDLAKLEFQNIRKNIRKNHALSCSSRTKLCCVKTWTCQRMVWFTTIIIVCILISISTSFAIGVLETEWRHGLFMAECSTFNCTQKPNPRQTFYEWTGNNSPSTCCCNMTFIPIVESPNQPHVPPQARNATSSYGCNMDPLFCRSDGYHSTSSCWIDPSSTIWNEPTKLWPIKLIAILVICALGGIMGAIVLSCTDSSPNELLPHNLKTGVIIENNYRHSAHTLI